MAGGDDYDSWCISTLDAPPGSFNAQAGQPGGQEAAPPGGGSADQPGAPPAPGDPPPATPPTPTPPGAVPVGPDHVAEMDAVWQDALAHGDWQRAAQVVNGFNAADLKARLAPLAPANIALLHQGAIQNRAVGQNSAVALATAAISHPIVGQAQSDRAGTMEHNLSPEDQQAYHQVLDGAATPKAREYITKGLAAGHSVAELKAFADKIAGKDDKWMQDNLALTGDSNGKGVQQQWSMSCNATAEEAVRGEMDPLYALNMHELNPNLTTVDRNDGMAKNPNMAADQRAQLQSAYPNGAAGGQAVAINSGIQVPGRWNTDLLNNVQQSTGISYSNQKIGTDTTMDQAVTDINAGLSKGMPVPIVVGDGQPRTTYAHYVVITATDPGPPRYYSIHDPGTGNTVVCSEDQLRTGTLGVSWPKISAIEKPTEIKLRQR